MSSVACGGGSVRLNGYRELPSNNTPIVLWMCLLLLNRNPEVAAAFSRCLAVAAPNDDLRSAQPIIPANGHSLIIFTLWFPRSLLPWLLQWIPFLQVGGKTVVGLAEESGCVDGAVVGPVCSRLSNMCFCFLRAR